MRDWGRSDDDQRHRLVINGTVNTSMAPATTAWERISHGFQVSSMLQYYSALPVQHHVGRREPAGHHQPAARQWRDRCRRTSTCAPSTFIPRNAGIGSDFFSLNLRVSRAFRISGDVKIEGLVEAFNLTNRVNNLTRNSISARGVPANPVSTFNQITAVGDPRTFQFGVRPTF